MKFVDQQHFSREIKQGSPSRETLQENTLSLKYMFTKNVVFGLQPVFFEGFNVLLSFLVEKWYRTNMNLPQKTSFGSETCEIEPKVETWTCPSCPKSSKWGRNPPENKGLVLCWRQHNRILKSQIFCWLHKLRNTQGKLYGTSSRNIYLYIFIYRDI